MFKIVYKKTNKLTPTPRTFKSLYLALKWLDKIDMRSVWKPKKIL